MAERHRPGPPPPPPPPPHERPRPPLVEGFRGDRVRLVPPDRALHLDNAVRWLNDPEVTATLKVHLGVTRRQEESFFDRIEMRDANDIVWAIHDEAGRHIGFSGLHGIDWRNRSATGGLVLGERDAWGRGYATDAVRVRTRLAFDRLNLHRVAGHSFNPAMCRVYVKCGYRHEGTARGMFWRDGRYHDAELYAILAEDVRAAAGGGSTG